MKPLLLLLLAACASTPVNTQKPQASVALSASDGSMLKVDVEVVDTDAGRQRGMMERASLGENSGMLFLFPREDQLTFWMRNTLIPLDIVFIRSDMSILGIVESAEPLTDTQRFVPGNSQFVLEVNGGYCKKHNVAAGSRVRFDNTPPIPKE